MVVFIVKCGMEECIRDMCSKLKLTEKEASGVVITKGATETAIKNGDLCLVVKLFANRFFSGEIVIEAMRRAWMMQGNVEFKAVGNNIFFFQFQSRSDLLRVKNGGPWNVDQHLLALEFFDGRLAPAEYKFQSINVWLHVIDPPLMLMTTECARQIGRQVGRYIKWDKGSK